MTFNRDVRLDPNRVRTTRGRRGAAAGGGVGLGVIVLFLLSQALGVDLTGLAPATGGGGGEVVAEETDVAQDCLTGEDANRDVNCRMVGALESLDQFWSAELPESGHRWVAPGATIFQDAVDTGCGAATSAVGPFYCPRDQGIYIDTGFFADLRSRFGSSGGPLAEMYVMAHEYGHHIETITGWMERADRRGTGPESDSVRIELAADCLAGMWVGAASTVPDPDTGVPFLEPVTEAQIADALSAAAAVGDDRIQEQASGTVNPEAWTHGSSEQRQRWFLRGFHGASLEDCNALEADRL
jgi:uncharacterized protein